MIHEPILTDAEILQEEEYSPRRKFVVLAGMTAFLWGCIFMGLKTAGVL